MEDVMLMEKGLMSETDPKRVKCEVGRALSDRHFPFGDARGIIRHRRRRCTSIIHLLLPNNACAQAYDPPRPALFHSCAALPCLLALPRLALPCLSLQPPTPQPATIPSGIT
jgi:hypothetical protein